MGERGPVPKRESQRRRTNKPERPTVHAATTPSVTVPDADPNWHPVALRWFESLAQSGQSAFYTASDWATAFVVAESMSRELKPQPLVVGRGEDATVKMVSMPPKGASLAAWLKAMSSLMVTEGDRRRAGLELDRAVGGEEATGDVSELDEYRQRLRSG